MARPGVLVRMGAPLVFMAAFLGAGVCAGLAGDGGAAPSPTPQAAPRLTDKQIDEECVRLYPEATDPSITGTAKLRWQRALLYCSEYLRQGRPGRPTVEPR